MQWIFFANMPRPFTQRALAERLAENEPVLIIGQPISVWQTHGFTPWKIRCRQMGEDKAFWSYFPLHFPEGLPGTGRIVKKLNRYLLQKELGRFAGRKEGRIVFFDSPSHYSLVKKLGEQISIYFALDDRTLTVEGSPIAGEIEVEKLLLAKVDKVICVSQDLAETLKKRMRADRIVPVYVLPNGYDERLFDPHRNWSEPSLLKSISRPRILVAGHITERIDWHGLMEAARRRPHWTWIFSGPADPGMAEKIKELAIQLSRGDENKRISKVVWLGCLQHDSIPALMAHCDACAIPYRLNKFTRASNPLKAAEYLAMGSPVVSTRVPSLARYGESIHWVEAGEGESYARALDMVEKQAGDEEGKKFRQRLVAEDSWKARAQQLKEMVFGDQTA